MEEDEIIPLGFRLKREDIEKLFDNQQLVLQFADQPTEKAFRAKADGAAKSVRQYNEETELFVSGDHWQGGHGWVGWTPDPRSENALQNWTLLEKGFDPVNHLAGIVNRLNGAVVGKEPDFAITLNTEQTESLDTETERAQAELDATITAWYQSKDIHKKLQEFFKNRIKHGKTGIRLYIPNGLLSRKKVADAKGQTELKTFIKSESIKEVLEKIFVEVPHHTEIGDKKDINFGTKVNAIRVPKEDDSDDDIYEYSFIDSEGNTVLSQLQNDTVSAVRVNLKGNHLINVFGEWDQRMITPTMKAQQRTVNMAKTMEAYQLGKLNFPEIIVTNADIQTESGVGENGKKTPVLKPLARGINAFLNFVGFVDTAGDGSEKTVTPTVHISQPVDPTFFAKVAERNSMDIFSEAGMAYKYLGESPYLSGESRIESMTDYLILLVDSKTDMDKIGTWLITTVILLAHELTGIEPPDFKVIFNTMLTIGRVSNEDKTVMLAEVSQGLRSKRGYMIKAEVSDDPEKELRIVRADQKDDVENKPKEEPIDKKPPIA